MDFLSSTLWQVFSQTWFPHFNGRPQTRPQDIFGLASQQAQSAISWPPAHSIDTFSSHFGCGNILISYFSGWISHGPAGLKFLSTTWVLTASWHLAIHGCAQLVVSFLSKHLSKHGGHSPIWHLCSLRWWHLEGILHGRWHLGGFVFFSRPHWTCIVVFPQL